MVRAMVAALLGHIFIWPHIIPESSAPPLSFAMYMVADTVSTALGGWLCATIALGDKRALWALIIIGELAGIHSTFSGWNTVPHWYSFFLLIASPPAIWYGAKILRPVGTRL
jgi:hypothetical protein